MIARFIYFNNHERVLLKTGEGAGRPRPAPY